MPVALHHAVWLHRCRRCAASFICPSEARLCSAACRTAAKRDAYIRPKANCAARSVDERRDGRGAWTFVVYRKCGKQWPAFRATKRFCSVKCRVAAHRASPAEKLDMRIADTQAARGGQHLADHRRPLRGHPAGDLQAG